MAEKNEVAKKQEFTTGLSQWTNTITELVSRDFEQNGVQYDEYSKQCAMNAMSSIYQLVQNTDKADMNNLNTSNLREVVAQCASLKLNANAMPREVYFQLRSKQVNGQWVKMVEIGVEGDGNDALLRQFGNNVDTVYPVWLVKEGDDFTYPRRRGIEIEPAEWTPKGLSDKTVRVVYPVKLKDGTIDYLIAEREPVKTNLIAHIRNNLMNETFGICENRYKATDKQKAEIKAKKEEILSAFRACETVDDMLKCEYAVTPYVSAAWLDTPEAMIVRKMRNNAIKKFPKNLNSMASSSLLQLDETYKAYGIYITFGNKLPKKFIIRTYADNVLNDTLTIQSGIANDFEIQYDFPEYDKMEIEFVETEPNSRIHVDYISIGSETSYRIEYDDLYSTPVGTQLDRIKNVRVARYLYSKSSVEDELATEMLTYDGENAIYYMSDACYGYTVSIEDGKSGQLANVVSSGAYYVEIAVSGVAIGETVNITVRRKWIYSV